MTIIALLGSAANPAEDVSTVAIVALAVAILSLGWQVVAWLASQRPRAKVEVQFARASSQMRYLVSYDKGAATAAPTEGSGRGALLARVHNRGVHAFEVTEVSVEPVSGEGEGLHVIGIPDADPSSGIACTIPGVVASHSQGLIWMYVEDLAKSFPPDASLQVRVGLGSGKILVSAQVPMAELLAFSGREPEATGH